MRGLSLRARVMAGMAAVAIVLVVAALMLTTTTRAHLVDQVDDRLAGAARPERDELGPRPAPPDGPGKRLGDVYEGVIGPDGELDTIFEPNVSGEELPVPEIDAERAASAATTREPFTTAAVDDPTSGTGCWLAPDRMAGST